MQKLTTGGEERCTLEGDYLSWTDMQWTLHGGASNQTLTKEDVCTSQGRTFNFFGGPFPGIQACAKHCRKLGNRMPSITNPTEWTSLQLFLRKNLWDKGIVVGNFFLALTDTREEGVWRDYYTGEQLENYTNSCYKSNGGKDMGEAYNCVYYRSTFAQTRTWIVWQCLSTSLRGFPCTYVSPPLIHLRGSCPDTQLEKSYTVTQFASDPKNIIMVGTVSAQIRFLCSWQTKLDSIRLQVQMF